MKLSSRLLLAFGRKICKKTTNLGIWTRLGKLGVMHNIGWWLVGKPIVNILFALIELFWLSITVLELWDEVSGVFTGGSTSLDSNFT